MSTNAELAERWVTGMASGDFSSLDPFQSPDMQVWHSYDGAWISVEESKARMSGPAPELRDVRATPTDTGFVLQATLDGPKGPIHLVQVNAVEDGLVVRCEEYVANQSVR